MGKWERKTDNASHSYPCITIVTLAICHQIFEILLFQIAVFNDTTVLVLAHIIAAIGVVVRALSYLAIPAMRKALQNSIKKLRC